MALQDLTPQLRTRLSRIERGVGWFVVLATLLLVSGFVYYAYDTAQRKGWFLTKAPYYTYTDRATGLKVGDPVKLMGLDVGQITHIEPMKPYDAFNMYVEFEIKDPYYGYLWTDGSRAKVTSADLLGQRSLEVTKGTKGYPTYKFNPLREVSIEEAAAWREPETWQLAEEIRDASGTNVLLAAEKPLSKTALDLLVSLGRQKVRVLNTNEQRRLMTAVWDDFHKRYDFYARTNLYWLLSEESPAVTERLDKLVTQVEKALPNFLSLTNQIVTVLTNAATLASNLNLVALNTQPAVSNLTAITDELRGRGALGEWLLPTNLHAELETTLTNANRALLAANTALSNADTNLAAVVENLNRSLENLANITSNLNHQVQANTNILSSISDAVVHTDDLIQGLKRHWLLRSAFKTKFSPPTNAPPANLRSPKDSAR